MIVVVLDSSSAAVRPQTAVLPWHRVERDTRETSRECELVMADRAAAPLYSGDDRVARLSYLASCGATVCVALSTRILIVWALLLSTHSYRLVFSNELTTIHEYLTQYVLSRLSSVGEHAPESINGDGCVFNNRLRSVVSRNLIATNAIITDRLCLFHCARKCSFSRMVLLRYFACSPVRVASIFSAVSVSS